MNQENKILVMVIGPAYSGSTLLGLGLGQHDSIINLGEVQYLYKDYKPHTKCTCGEPLSTCPQWSKFQKSFSNGDKENLHLKLEENYTHPIDKKGGLYKLLIVLNIPLKWIFRKTLIPNYIQRNKAFFDILSTQSQNSKCIVDISKSP